jgi:hypothetical protein
MALSNTWRANDNVYSLNRRYQTIINNGVMGLFETTTPVGVNSCIVDYCKTHNRSECLLYNNRLYFGITNPSEASNVQYNFNRDYILNYFK